MSCMHTHAIMYRLFIVGFSPRGGGAEAANWFAEKFQDELHICMCPHIVAPSVGLQVPVLTTQCQP